MSESMEFGPSGNEQREARYKMAFEGSFAIFRSDQVESYVPEDDAEELTLRVVSRGNDALSRLGVGRIETTYVGSTLHENGYQDPETINMTAYASTGEELGSYTLSHDVASASYSMTVEPDESSPLFDRENDMLGHPASDVDIMEYLSILDSVKENLTYSGDNL